MTKHLTALFGAIELGGTKINLAVGAGPDRIAARTQVPTRGPDETLAAVAAFFLQETRLRGPLAALGVGAFGPIILNPDDSEYGRLCPSPKPGWGGYDLLAALRRMMDCPVALATDVAAAGVGEAHCGALSGLDCGVYLTIGTGIGAAIIVRGAPLPALLHSEFGHLPLRRLPRDVTAGLCPFHGDCAEGLVAGPAIAARFGKPLNAFAADGPEMALVAEYVGQLCAAIVLAVSPKRIVLGGGVAKAHGLHAAATAAALRALNGYAIHGIGEGYIAPPALGDDAGVIGGLVLAMRRWKEQS
jgi:fructokinase